MKIKSLVKKIIPNRILQIIRLGTSNVYYYKIMKYIEKQKNNKNIVYIFGSAIHTNLGDHLITLSERKFLNDYLKGKEIIEIPTEMYQVYREKLKRYISKNNLIVINGGGWMGNLWVKEEKLIQDMVSIFKDNRIIIFPQTIYFDREIKPYEELIEEANETYGINTKLTITVREQNSYDFAKNNYKEARVLLVPDIALYFAKYANTIKNTTPKRNIVKFCLRNDRENVKSKEYINLIKNILEENNLKIGKIDTMYKLRVSEKNRYKVIDLRLKEFAKCKLIITDRLHGMIFSYIVGTPCIILDNKTRKVSGVYEKWLNNSDKIYPLYKMNDKKKLEKFILNAINQNNFYDNNKIDFEELEKEIKNG